MPRERLCKVCRGWHPPDDWPEACWQPRVVARADLPMPMVIGDGIPDLKSQVDGKVYSSKSELRRSYKAAGVIEVGNEPIRPGERHVDPHKDRKQMAAIADAMKRVGLPTT